MANFDNQTINKQLLGARWSALARTGLSLDAVGRFDTTLLRDTRVLVPIDVQALYVPAGSSEAMTRLPLAIAAPDGQPMPPATAYLADGPARPAGVHLRWAMPDALLRGSLGDNGPANRLALPALPDRWVVLRVLAPKGSATPQLRGWVIEADTTRVVPLEQWPAGAAAVAATGRTVPAEALTGSCGGSLNWTGVYDATLNRFALHDPLDDLATLAPAGVEGEQVAYLVAGWWSQATLDPLDGAQTDSSLHERLRQLGWALVEDREDTEKHQQERRVLQEKQASVGLDVATRYATKAVALKAGLRAAPTTASAKLKPGLQQATAAFADKATAVVQTEPHWPRSSLLHGSLYGVPVSGPATVDNRPAASELQAVWGEHGEDVAATLASTALAPADAAARRAYERLLAAFTGNLIDRIDSGDGLVDVEEWEHAAGYASRPGGDGGTDRLLEGADGGPLAAGRHARGAVARASAAALKGEVGTSTVTGTKVSFGRQRKELQVVSKDEQRTKMSEWGETEKERAQKQSTPAQAGRAEPAVREVKLAAPRLYTPGEPLLALRGARRSLIHGGDGRHSADGKLNCRYPSQVIRAIEQVIDGSEILPTLGTAAVPDEVLLLARELLMHNPYWATWLAGVASARHGLDGAATRKRMMAEAALRFGSTEAVYDGTSGAFSRKVSMAGGATRATTDARIADQLRRFSLFQGVDPDPVGVTAWSQPWIPLWLEWELGLELGDTLEGWSLGTVDLQAGETVPATPIARTVQGRSPLTTGTANNLSGAVRAWLSAEDQRDKNNQGEASESTEAALARIAAAVDQLDVLSANFDGMREQLLGFAYDGGLPRVRLEDGTLGDYPRNGQTPLWLRGGVLRMQRARIVDAYGRTLDIPLERLSAPQRLALPATAPLPATARGEALRLPPRLTLPARLMFRLVDPAARGDEAAEANVDQVEPTRMVNPVMGFLLPDHIDEALEVFDATGAPLGQLMHEPIGGGVVWEIAPGREGPADAGPLFGLSEGATHLGRLAAGTVTADAQVREGASAGTEDESALSALLRSIDTTMWSVDALRSMGTEHIAGLVGRPIAVVRARLRLDIQGDYGLDAAAATLALADRAFTVRIGEITRSDDAVLGYFIDDDYAHVHVVDKVVAQQAIDSGRLRGQLAGIDTAAQVPGTRPITHPYVVAEDELQLRPGQTVMLTLLMHPAGKAHATCGVLPRKSLQLARDWVAPALAVIAPSARIGPVLIDPAQVRLPKISSFPKNQLFTRRDTPSSWKDDPILAATQEALLPELPHEVQEGYIRIAPEPAPKRGP